MPLQSTATPRPDIGLTIVQDGFSLDEYIWPLLLPAFPVQVSIGTIPKITGHLRIERISRPRYGGFTRGTVTATDTATFNCAEVGHEQPYDAKDVEVYGSENNAQIFSGQVALGSVLRKMEYAAVSSLFSTTLFSANYQHAAVATWSTESANPINDVVNATLKLRKQCGAMKGTLFISAGTVANLQKNSTIQTRYRQIMGFTNASKGTDINLDLVDLARVLGVEKVVAGGARYDSADENQTRNVGFIVPDTMALLVYQPPVNDPMAPHMGRTFTWEQGLMSWGAAGVKSNSVLNGTVLEEYYDTTANVAIMRARAFNDLVVLNKESAVLITNVG
jgi:hypothetical protein